MISIRSTRPHGHYRCGKHHGPHHFLWPDDAFTAVQIALMEHDPWLIVERIPEKGIAAGTTEAVTVTAADVGTVEDILPPAAPADVPVPDPAAAPAPAPEPAKAATKSKAKGK